MAAAVREQFSSQTAPEVLASLRHIAKIEGRQFQAVLDEALQENIERKEKGQPRRQVMNAFGQSLKEFDELYRELAT